MDKDTREMFNTMIGEFDKLNQTLNDKMDMKFAKLDAKIDYVYESLTHEINACKLDRDVVNMLVDKTEELDKRVSALEERQKRKQRFRLL